MNFVDSSKSWISMQSFAKAKMYIGRAIMAKPEDENVCSLYANSILQTKKGDDWANCHFYPTVATA